MSDAGGRCSRCGSGGSCCAGGCPFTELFDLPDGRTATDRPELLLAFVQAWYKYQAGTLPRLDPSGLPVPPEDGEVLHAWSDQVKCMDLDFGYVMGKAIDHGRCWVTDRRLVFASPYQLLEIALDDVVHHDVAMRLGFLVQPAGGAHPVSFYTRTGDLLGAALEGALKNRRRGARQERARAGGMRGAAGARGAAGVAGGVPAGPAAWAE